MKAFILTFAVFYLALFLSSCSSESAYKEDYTATESSNSSPKETYDNAFSELERSPKTNLSSKQKEAFQLRAIQKFQDFIDYIKIISNPKVDADLKEHSSLLAQELFTNDSIRLSNFLVQDTVQSIQLKQYLSHIIPSKKPIIIKVENIEFVSPLTLDSLNNYKGMIRVKLKTKGNYFTNNIEVNLIEVKKDFGNKNEVISEVRLGNID